MKKIRKILALMLALVILVPNNLALAENNSDKQVKESIQTDKKIASIKDDKANLKKYVSNKLDKNQMILLKSIVL